MIVIFENGDGFTPDIKREIMQYSTVVINMAGNEAIIKKNQYSYLLGENMLASEIVENLIDLFTTTGNQDNSPIY